MRLTLLAVTMFPLICSAGTLADFFKSHPDLDSNFPVHTAISKASRFEAAGFARREGGDEGELMDARGDDFALLGFRRIKNACQYPEAAKVIGLSQSDCALVLNKEL
ncbi:hypothetical protein GKQ23_13585 [Erwinia sp. E602]|uniref:hypothetical protein n=1 Tax=Erwinia sp. E602 TaxID=2675378 RepID=UPI001BA77944|nr:hypothetical protein [Erwinia sp. E602]QUG75963.1 hypothetical protein GKQ23_13585 [Erwinia sp. E602]